MIDGNKSLETVALGGKILLQAVALGGKILLQTVALGGPKTEGQQGVPLIRRPVSILSAVSLSSPSRRG